MKINFLGNSGVGMVVEVDGLWKLAGMISNCIHMRAEKENGKNVSICDFNNYLVYTDVSKFNSWIEQVIVDSYNSEFDGVVDEASAGRSMLGNTFQMKLFFFIFLSVFLSNQ